MLTYADVAGKRDRLERVGHVGVRGGEADDDEDSYLSLCLSQEGVMESFNCLDGVLDAVTYADVC